MEKDLTGIILMPAVMREIWKHPETVNDAEAALEVCAAYKTELDRFAFTEERDDKFYENFKDMISRYSPIFQKDYAFVEFLKNEQIDYVLERVREEREAYAAAAEKTLVKKIKFISY